MNATKRILLLLFFLTGGNAFAAPVFCTYNGVSPTALNFGNVVVPRDAPIGAPIGAPVITTVSVTCPVVAGPVGLEQIDFYVSSLLPQSPVVSRTWATSFAGVGMQVKNIDWGSGVFVSAPSSGNNVIYAPPYASNSATTLSFHLSFQLVKTAATVQAGPYTQPILNGFSDAYYNNANMGLQTFDPKGYLFPVSATANIINGTCTVQNPSIAVALSNVPVTQLNGVGSTAGSQGFNINLSCAQGVNVYVTFTDSTNPANTGSTLTPAAGTTASGVALQLLMNNALVSYGPDATSPGTTNQLYVGPSANSATLPMVARYVATSTTVTPGAVRGVSTFTMSYQ